MIDTQRLPEGLYNPAVSAERLGLPLVVVFVALSTAGCDTAFSREDPEDREARVEAEYNEAEAVNDALKQCMREAGARVELPVDDLGEKGPGALASFTPERFEERAVVWTVEAGEPNVWTEWPDLRPRERAVFEGCLAAAAPGYENHVQTFEAP